MSNRFYKTRKNRLVAGVVAGLADKFGWDLALARILAVILMEIGRASCRERVYVLV